MQLVYSNDLLSKGIFDVVIIQWFYITGQNSLKTSHITDLPTF